MAEVPPSQGGQDDQNGQKDLKMPKDFTPMCTILDGDVAGIRSVMGLIKDARLPMMSKGGDWKMTLKLFDRSLEAACSVLEVHLFGKHEDMLSVDVGDVVLVRAAKVQSYNGQRSLISNYNTSVFVYTATAIPPPPQSAQAAMKPPKWKTPKKLPSAEEHRYAAWLYHTVDKDNLPEVVAFTAMVAQTVHAVDKFVVLKDATDGRFYDLVVRVVHPPLVTNQYATLWVSDYTVNPRFQDFVDPKDPDGTADRDRDSSGGGGGGQVGDPNGYLNPHTARTVCKQVPDWKGPVGKRSMQITCFEPHYSFIRDYVTVGKWVSLKNVQTRMGRNLCYLEGFMRSDEARGDPLRVHLITAHPDDDPDTIDPHFKDALRRTRAYLVQRKAQRHQKQTKRKADDLHKLNARGKRVLLRTDKLVAYEGPGAAPVLNHYIVAEHADRPITCLTDVLASGALPFVNNRFRAQVRVVDFVPPRLESFAVARRVSEFDALSDNEDYPDMDDGDGDDDANIQGPPIWEWRFALLLEDASPAAATPPARLWAMVNNAEAQMLTNLNACDLLTNIDVYDLLREKMFVLWGDLEESKRAFLRAKKTAEIAKRKEEQQQKKTKEAQAVQVVQAAQSRNPLQQEPDDSDAEAASQKKAEMPASLAPAPAPPVEMAPAHNVPFVCCVQQYGVRVQPPDDDVNNDDHNDDHRKESEEKSPTWQRMFGLFGTVIKVANA